MEYANNSLVNDKNKLKEQYAQKMNKYVTYETICTLSDHIENLISVGFNAIIFPIIFEILALVFSIYIGYIYNSILAGIIVFIALIPITIIGIGFLGLAKAISDFSSAFVYIVEYIIHINIEVRKSAREEGLRELSKLETSELILKKVVFPAVKKIIHVKFLGGFIYYTIKKIILRTEEECFDVDLTIKDAIEDKNENDSIRKKIHAKILKTILKTTKGISILLSVIGILSIIVGLFLLLLIFLAVL
jgi:hypothetical protein